jgi:hypothetical protein
VQIADGKSVVCSSKIVNAKWDIQGYDFCFDLMVLPLHHFDMIIGYDWLQSFSPMRVHWKEKWLAIPYAGTTVVLQGVLSELSTSTVVQVYQLTKDDLHLDTTEGSLVVKDVLPEVKHHLNLYADVFATQVGAPPDRLHKHSIPLVPGARPFHIRPYRYAPSLKDEIEHQVQQMLEAGIIQNNVSPFSSPVLLVKKDNSYRLCVDYRHLDAITLKGQYLVPIIDEFLDELKMAS